MSDTITLRDVVGVPRKSGIDADGLAWIQFEVDYLAQQEAGECAICHDTIEEGWLCLDGGEEVCDSHVILDLGGE